MKTIQIVVYGAMFSMSLGWGTVLYKLLEFSKFESVIGGTVLGPSTVMLLLYFGFGRSQDQSEEPKENGGPQK